MWEIVRADVYNEISILKGLRHRKSDHPEGATEDREGRVGPNADHAETDLDWTTNSAVKDLQGIGLRVHFRSAAFEWYFRPGCLLTSILPWNFAISSKIQPCTSCSDIEHMDEHGGWKRMNTEESLCATNPPPRRRHEPIESTNKIFPSEGRIARSVASLQQSGKISAGIDNEGKKMNKGCGERVHCLRNYPGS